MSKLPSNKANTDKLIEIAQNNDVKITHFEYFDEGKMYKNQNIEIENFYAVIWS